MPTDFQYQVQEILNRCFDDTNNRLNVFPQVRDDESLALGVGSDVVFHMRSTVLAADAEVTGLIVGTSEHPGVAANSLIVSNITSSGDILLLVNVGGNSQGVFWADGSSGDTAVMAASGASFDVYIAGTKQIDYATGALAFQQATTISTTATTLTLSPTTDVHIPDGKGLVIGHTAQVSFGAALPELQVLGTTSGTDTVIALGRWSADAYGPRIYFGKSRNATVGSFTIAVADDELLRMLAMVDDGVDLGNWGAEIGFYAGSTLAENSVSAYIRFDTANGAATPTERWRITQVGVLTSVAGVPANAATADGSILATGGTAFTDVANAWIDDATHGTGTVVHYIGNNTIDTTAPSDARLKEVLGPTALLASPLLRQMELVDYRWKADGQDVHFGWTAQQMYSVLPELIHVPENGDPWHVKGHTLVPYLLKGWQEHDSRLLALEAENIQLRAEVAALRR